MGGGGGVLGTFNWPWILVSSCHVQYTYTYLPLGRFAQDMVHPNHLGKNGAIAEGVAQGVQPGSDLTIKRHVWVGTSSVEVMFWK